MFKKKLNRRTFIGTTTAGLAFGAVKTSVISVGLISCKKPANRAKNAKMESAEGFARLVDKYLPSEKLYAYHKQLLEEPVHIPRRDANAQPKDGEMSISATIH